MKNYYAYATCSLTSMCTAMYVFFPPSLPSLALTIALCIVAFMFGVAAYNTWKADSELRTMSNEDLKERVQFDDNDWQFNTKYSAEYRRRATEGLM